MVSFSFQPVHPALAVNDDGQQADGNGCAANEGNGLVFMSPYIHYFIIFITSCIPAFPSSLTSLTSITSLTPRFLPPPIYLSAPPASPRAR